MTAANWLNFKNFSIWLLCYGPINNRRRRRRRRRRRILFIF
jgi:hypothetical protein